MSYHIIYVSLHIAMVDFKLYHRFNALNPILTEWQSISLVCIRIYNISHQFVFEHYCGQWFILFVIETCPYLENDFIKLS